MKLPIKAGQRLAGDHSAVNFELSVGDRRGQGGSAGVGGQGEVGGTILDLSPCPSPQCRLFNQTFVTENRFPLPAFFGVRVLRVARSVSNWQNFLFHPHPQIFKHFELQRVACWLAVHVFCAASSANHVSDIVTAFVLDAWYQMNKKCTKSLTTY